MNRGGSLFVDHMQYGDYPELAEARSARRRGHPLWHPSDTLFVGYDGQYYLCCSDWEKQARSAACSTCRSSTSPRPSSTWSSPATRVPHLQPGPDQPSHRGAAGRGRRCCRLGRRGGGQDRRRQRGRRGRPAPAGPRGAGRAAHPAAHPGAGGVAAHGAPERLPPRAARGRAPARSARQSDTQSDTLPGQWGKTGGRGTVGAGPARTAETSCARPRSRARPPSQCR